MDEQPQNQFPQTNPPQRPTVWEANPKLKSLLLVLIVVFLLSGLGLAGLSLWNQQYRTKLYQETQAGLPKHEIKNSATTDCQTLPSDISSRQEFNDWVNKHGLDGKNFCGPPSTTIKEINKNGFQSNQECQKAITDSDGAGQYISNGSGKAICMGGFGEPDQAVMLIDSQAKQSSTLLACGTPCNYESGVWLDSNRFVLLESDDIDGSGKNMEYRLTYFDFKNNTSQVWIQQTATAADWKTYKNDEYGFELKFPPTWAALKVEKDGLTFDLPYADTGKYSPVCDIAFFTDEQWTYLTSGEGPQYYVVFTTDKNNQKVAYACGQDDSGYVGFEEYNKNFHTNSSDFKQGPYYSFENYVIPTFKFTK